MITSLLENISISQSSATLILVASVTAAYFYRQAYAKKVHNDLGKIPGPPSMLVGGSYEWMSLTIAGKDHEYQEGFPQRYGPILKSNPIFNLFNLVIVTNANEAQRILTDTINFRKDEIPENKAIGILDFALFLMPSSDLHKRHRKLIQPAFAPSHLRQVSKMSVAVMSELHEVLQTKAVDGRIQIENVDKLMMDITLDVLGLVAFGKKFGAVAGSKDKKTQIWHELESKITKPFTIRIALPEFLWPVFGVATSSPGISEFQTKMNNFFRTLAAESKAKVQSALPTLSNGNDSEKLDKSYQFNVFERLLLCLEQGTLTEKEVFGEMLAFFGAGHETSSHTLSFTLLELAKNQEIQENLFEEIKSVDLTVDNLNDAMLPLKTLDNCVKESQRLHAIVGAVPREAATDTDILGYKIPAGTKLLVNIRGVHLSEDYYDNPTQYDPERWNQPQKNAHAFLPFSQGNHACIGMKMAIIEIKMVLICLLQKYKVKIDASALENLTYTTRVTLKPENLSLIFESRS